MKSVKGLSRLITAIQVAMVIGGILAFFLPVVGLVVALLGFALYGVSQKRERLRDDEQRATQQRTEERIRHLNTRELSDEEIDILKRACKDFSGQLFWIITQTNDYNRHSEQMIFSIQLTEILISQGWVNGGFTGQRYRKISDSGIEIASGTGDGANAAAVRLIETLASFFITTNQMAIVYRNINPDLVLIDIGLN